MGRSFKTSTVPNLKFPNYDSACELSFCNVALDVYFPKVSCWTFLGLICLQLLHWRSKKNNLWQEGNMAFISWKFIYHLLPWSFQMPWGTNSFERSLYRQFTFGGGGGWREGEGVYCLTPPPFLIQMGGGGRESIKIQNWGGGGVCTSTCL